MYKLVRAHIILSSVYSILSELYHSGKNAGCIRKKWAEKSNCFQQQMYLENCITNRTWFAVVQIG